MRDLGIQCRLSWLFVEKFKFQIEFLYFCKQTSATQHIPLVLFVVVVVIPQYLSKTEPTFLINFLIQTHVSVITFSTSNLFSNKCTLYLNVPKSHIGASGVMV